jgi:tetratricopeptide (TPR) repeat protein
MNPTRPAPRETREHSKRPSPWPWILLLIALLVTFLLIILPRTNQRTSDSGPADDAKSLATSSPDTTSATSSRHRRGASVEETAEEIVTRKLAQFGRSRREIARQMGRRAGDKEMPPEVEAFFDAVEKGDWAEIEARWKPLANWSGQYKRKGEDDLPARRDLNPYWCAVLEAYGAAEAAHEWPAQKLLDYGDKVLGSLRPGMVYVGGTDPGRFIPTLLNETGDGEKHVVLTQNALADSRYDEYIRFLHGDQFGISPGESQHAFQEYMDDAQKRLLHDQQFPDEPKQIRPGENITMTDGRVQVSGQVAVMAINEKLLQMILQKNPDATFALEESFPLKGTYADASPLGPLMELRASDGGSSLTVETANQSVDYWNRLAQQLTPEPDGPNTNALMTYAHMATAQANLFVDRELYEQAEQTYRTAVAIWPGQLDTVTGLAGVLAKRGRGDEARQLLDDFARSHPKQRAEIDVFRGSITVVATPRP